VSGGGGGGQEETRSLIDLKFEMAWIFACHSLPRSDRANGKKEVILLILLKVSHWVSGRRLRSMSGNLSFMKRVGHH
jgi:hypothetical protein